MYKVRFNLGRGKRYLKWKIENLETKQSEYRCPKEVSLILKGCTLKNNKKAAEVIFSGKSKRVCSWVLCEEVIISEAKLIIAFDMLSKDISYNPRVEPYWREDGENVDGKKYDELYTDGRQIKSGFYWNSNFPYYPKDKIVRFL